MLLIIILSHFHITITIIGGKITSFILDNICYPSTGFNFGRHWKASYNHNKNKHDKMHYRTKEFALGLLKPELLLPFSRYQVVMSQKDDLKKMFTFKDWTCSKWVRDKQ